RYLDLAHHSSGISGFGMDRAFMPPELLDMRAAWTLMKLVRLTADDLRGIEAVYHAFYWHGPIIQYSTSMGGGAHFPTYAQLMTATDAAGAERSYLASEGQYAAVKDLHARNLIVPVVGDFGGPKALRAVGRYLRKRRIMVGAFYLSNVEQYLGRERRWWAFCQNAAALPIDGGSTFIRSIRDGYYYANRGGLTSVLGSIGEETRGCMAGG
ncbi:MAG TPA: hypothetical protein VE379_10440, partial [Vicinamibacterales bacterium]|nr:hypothetical protein [Vicinamibacterales bacterium]